MTTDITICIIMGLPAVGKTTIAKQLFSCLIDDGCHCCLFSYDELMPELIDFHNSDNGQPNMPDQTVKQWKAYRKSVFEFIESCVRGIRENVWEETRKDATNCCDCIKVKSCLETTRHVVLIDDNMYYRSMRYPFYQLARTYACSFCQVYLSGYELEELVTRNTQRQSIVEESTIRKMAHIYEAPDPQKFYWEKNTLNLERIELKEKSIQMLDLFIRNSSKEIVPLLVSEQDKAERERCQKEILENYLHQCDQLIRKYISSKMAEEKCKSGEVTHKNRLKEIALHLNSQRKNYLQKLRTERKDVVDILSSKEDWKRDELCEFQSFSEKSVV